MKILYFDCFAGISGDMTIGALLDLGVDQAYFRQELKKLAINGYELKFGRINKSGLEAYKFDVVVEYDKQPKRNLYDIFKIIDESALAAEVKELSKKMFLRVAEAESKVHGEALSDVLFHEIGAVDSIIDFIGTAVCISYLKPDKILSSVVSDGYGFTTCRKGVIPIPVPATKEIFTKAQVVSRQIGEEIELVTPTGAAIIAELAQGFCFAPPMKLLAHGCGAGDRSSSIPNVLRVTLGEQIDTEQDEVLVLETNLDDCTGEILGYVMERLLEAGARDVFYTPIYMKKNRPAQKLTVVCKEEKAAVLEEIIFLETTTIGIRRRKESRTILERELLAINTPYGMAQVKKVWLKDMVRVYPEYEWAKETAKKTGIPLREIYKAIEMAAETVSRNENNPKN